MLENTLKISCLLLGVAGLSSCSNTGGKDQATPNFILILSDDLGWNDVGFNGNTEVRTPNLDRLASEGIILNRFYAASAVCSPTRAMTMNN